MKRMVRRAGLEEEFEIASAGTSNEEEGHPVYPLAKRSLAEHGIGCPGKTARQITTQDYGYYDMLIGLDGFNVRNMVGFYGADPDRKISRLLDHVPPSDTRYYGRDVADPWYTRKFNVAYMDIEAGCKALFDKLTADRPKDGADN